LIDVQVEHRNRDVVRAFSAEHAQRQPTESFEHRFLLIQTATNDAVIHRRVGPAVRGSVRGADHDVEILQRMESLPATILVNNDVVDRRMRRQLRKTLRQVTGRKACQIRHLQRADEWLQLTTNDPLILLIALAGAGDDEQLFEIGLQLANQLEGSRELPAVDESRRIRTTQRWRDIGDKHYRCVAKQPPTLRFHELHRHILDGDDQVESNVLILALKEIAQRVPVFQFGEARDIDELRVVVQLLLVDRLKHARQLTLAGDRELGVAPQGVERKNFLVLVRLCLRRDRRGGTCEADNGGKQPSQKQCQTKTRGQHRDHQSNCVVIRKKRGVRMDIGCSHEPPGTNVLL